jgi:hypothetical protein
MAVLLPRTGFLVSSSLRPSSRARSKTMLVDTPSPLMSSPSSSRSMTRSNLVKSMRSLKTVATAGACIWRAPDGIIRNIVWLNRTRNSFSRRCLSCGSYPREIERLQSRVFTAALSTRYCPELVLCLRLVTRLTSACGWSSRLEKGNENGLSRVWPPSWPSATEQPAC